MGLGRTVCAVLVGLDARRVDVEAHVSRGLVQWSVVGLPDAGVLEARDRVRSALLACGQAPPQARVTINLSPASLPKHGSAFDLGMAVAVLVAVGAVPAAAAAQGHLGELGLDGSVRPVAGVLPSVLGLVRSGVRRVVVPVGNVVEAALVPGAEIVGVGSLAETVAVHRGERPAPGPGEPGVPRSWVSPVPSGPRGACDARGAEPDLGEVVGQPVGRRALEVAAAGGHHLLLVGPPGSGKTMLASRLPGLLPDLDDADALVATAVQSLTAAGGVTGLVRRPGFEAPHHSASTAAVLGGGTGLPRPGAASRAHAGVLFLDEAPEFRRGVLDSLRQPLEEGRVHIHRSGGAATFPARFQLVLAANPCPCGSDDTPRRPCTCSSTARRRYLARLSGPLLDRIDLQVAVPPVTAGRWGSELAGEASEAVGLRVGRARRQAAARWGVPRPVTNATVPADILRTARFRPVARVLAPLVTAADRGLLTGRGLDRALRVAWTLADLDGRDSPGRQDVDAALEYRRAVA